MSPSGLVRPRLAQAARASWALMVASKIFAFWFCFAATYAVRFGSTMTPLALVRYPRKSSEASHLGPTVTARGHAR